MLEPRIPTNETARLASLHGCNISLEPEQAFDDLAALAARLCEMPIAVVSLVEADCQRFKAKLGVVATGTPRRIAFCAHAIHDAQNVMVVPDASADPRFADNPLVTGPPNVRFYAGAPIVLADGHVAGTLCVIDRQPRSLSASQLEGLQMLARKVATEMELRRKVAEVESAGAEVRRAHQDLYEFASSAVHDLRAPSRKVAVLCEILREDLRAVGQLSDAVSATLGHLEATAAHGHALVHDFAELLYFGSSALKREPTPIADCVAAANAVLSAEMQAAKASLVVDPMPTLDADRTLVTRMFQNLFANALNYSSSAPPVLHATCELVEDQWQFGVRDNGIGIAPADLERVFLAFQRLHHVPRRPGSGLGLAIVKSVAERHGGRAWVESTLGVGSHFQFTLGARTRVIRAPDAVGAGTPA